jgi:hypothetical protein
MCLLTRAGEVPSSVAVATKLAQHLQVHPSRHCSRCVKVTLHGVDYFTPDPGNPISIGVGKFAELVEKKSGGKFISAPTSPTPRTGTRLFRFGR